MFTTAVTRYSFHYRVQDPEAWQAKAPARLPYVERYAGSMRTWVISLAVCAAIPAWADTQFRVRQMTRNDVPRGKGQCDIRLLVDNEVEVTVRGDLISMRTISGRDGRDDGSECNAPLPTARSRASASKLSRAAARCVCYRNPSRQTIIRPSFAFATAKAASGRYHFRLSWDMDAITGMRPPDDRPGAGFAWNNVIGFRGRAPAWPCSTRRTRAACRMSPWISIAAEKSWFRSAPTAAARSCSQGS